MALSSFLKPILLLTTILSLTSSVLAQSSTVITPATSTGAVIFPGTSTWQYYGCYGETTLINGTNGARALNDGQEESLVSMTVQGCLGYCQSAGYAFAGLEYTQECYCAQYLSSLAPKKPDSACNLACRGNTSQFCGGNLVLSVYQAKNKKGAATGLKEGGKMGSVLALGIALGVTFWLA